MKFTIELFCKRNAGIVFMFLAIALAGSNKTYAQGNKSITGKVLGAKSNQAIPFATVVLIKTSDSKITGGTMSNENGVFNISPVISGSYLLKVSGIGFKPATKNIDVVNNGATDAGIILLQDTSVMLKESIITGERIKAKSGTDRTTFNVTKKMLDVSNSGTDLLKLIPGIQIDLMQNILLEGSPDFLIYVDGKERDKNFVSQLSPDKIDQIEVISSPLSNYDGNITGAINIILKKDSDYGINGHILAEIPVSPSLVYIFPSYSFNWGVKKLNLYTSYNGEITYLDLHESINRKVWYENDSNSIVLNQELRQKDWSHRFHYGFDYFLSDRDQFNFYGYYNPYSRELDGNVFSRTTGIINDSVKLVKEDTDLNTSTFCSLYYKHIFDKKGREITADISNYFMRSENKTDYFYNESDKGVVSQGYSVKPKQNAISLKMDFKTVFLDKLIFSTGVKAKFQTSQDRFNEFEYNENICAVYGKVDYKQKKIDLSVGLRAEKSVAELKNTFNNPFLSFLPDATFRYKLTSDQNIKLSFNRSIRRPNIYRLNPNTSLSDPYTLYKGNPFLKPELHNNLFLEHSIQYHGNYFSSRLYFSRTTDAINNLMLINDTNAFEIQVQNLGTISQLGLQFSGALKIGFVTLNPYIKIYNLHTAGNNLAKYYAIENKNRLGFESGLSAIASFKHDIAYSVNIQYNNAKNDIQGISFYDMLYFMSVEKTFKHKIKAGIVSAMPFSRSVTYNGSEIRGSSFQSFYRGDIKMTSLPFWFKIGYQFNSGKNRSRISREKEEIDNLEKKGF